MFMTAYELLQIVNTVLLDVTALDIGIGGR